ncbi:hypothetical protein [Desulfosporosinus sp. HMP52]|uniref:hypothetical protein n=1 Tax=Desulfosporosinus sp. HMP52 TaxID=1487923 RepID=UPI0006907533|nr:hypothetical protein [Desulfosporosinus sp. HMP52]
MKKFISKKVTAILGGAVLATGLIAIPAFAVTSNDEGQNLFGQMRSFMASSQHQEIMNSSAMQNMHNSEAMQEAMQTGDIAKMQEAMNSNPEVKALLGEETLNQMNQFMQDNGQAMSQMMQGQNLEAMNQMMNGQNATGMNQMMGQF